MKSEVSSGWLEDLSKDPWRSKDNSPVSRAHTGVSPEQAAPSLLREGWELDDSMDMRGERGGTMVSVKDAQGTRL